MIKEILTAAGVEHAQGRFLRMPAGTFAVYFDDIEVTAADRVATIPAEGLPRIYTHNVTVELYEELPDDVKETVIENELDARGLEWTKQDRYWLKDLQRYQTVYETTYTNKTK
jgi:hypothetical protein